MLIEEAKYDDLLDILDLQKDAYQSEALIYNDYSISPLTQTLDSLKNDFEQNTILKAVDKGKIIGSVRAYEEDGTCYIGRLIVHPNHQNKGVGKLLMKQIEQNFSRCKKFSLFTGNKSIKNLGLYNKLSYKAVKEEKVSENLSFIYLEKGNILLQA